MKLLDTTFLIDLVRGNEKTRTFLSDTAELVTTQINMFELIRGFFLEGAKPAKILELAGMFEAIRVLPMDDIAIIKSAEISADLTSRGAIIGDADCLIAGIALSKGVTTIVTKNSKDFKRVKGITIEEY
ncbi:type II toxin-antitoxin system VapC family toxin [Candidatus Woesearchaeota archaeon]|nr:type II toxin-antitoxin system VapC family toxin [Candidatus Woesearchaeota archaeon]